MAIRETSDAGRPIVASALQSEQTKVFLALAGKIWDQLTTTPARSGPKIVIE